jgi:hypothetical protein
MLGIGDHRLAPAPPTREPTRADPMPSMAAVLDGRLGADVAQPRRPSSSSTEHSAQRVNLEVRASLSSVLQPHPPRSFPAAPVRLQQRLGYFRSLMCG